MPLANPLATALGLLMEFIPHRCWLSEGGQRFSLTRLSEHLHLYTPTSARVNYPVLVFVHGGHGQAGTILPKKEAGGALSYAPYARAWATNGVAVALVGYPLCRTPDRLVSAISALLFAAVVAVSLGLAVATFHLMMWFFPGFETRTRMIVALAVFGALHFLLARFAFGVVRRVAPVHLQRAGTTVDAQARVVASQIASLHQHLGANHRLVVAGHSHGALLAALALGRDKPDYVDTFVGIGGIYDAPAMARDWSGLLGAVTRHCYLMPAFGTTNPDRLQALSPTHSPIRDSTRVWLVNGVGEYEVALAQSMSLMHSLTQCRQPRCSDRAHCADKSHDRRKDQALIGPIGMGHGMGLLCDQSTVIVLLKALSAGPVK